MQTKTNLLSAIPPGSLPTPRPVPTVVAPPSLAKRTIIGVALILEDGSSRGFKLSKPVTVHQDDVPAARIEIHGDTAFLTIGA